MTTYPSPSDPTTAFTRAGGSTELHSTDHGRVIGIWENVKHHGARGTGSFDDTTAIQAAIDAVRAAGGGTVYFPPTVGGYGVSATLTLGTSYGSASSKFQGIKLLGGSSTRLGYASSDLSSALHWIGSNGGGPMLEVRQSGGLLVEGIEFDADNKATECVVVKHASGDTSSPHLVTFRLCSFQRGKTYNVRVGVDSLASGYDSDACCVSFESCLFTSIPGGQTGSTTVAQFRGTSANALPVNFYNCEFNSDYLVTQYNLSLTGGSYNLFGCLASGAITSTFYMGSEGDTVPPNISVYGHESQGDASLIRTSAGGSSAAPQRASVLSGVTHGGDGVLTLAADSIQWGYGNWCNLSLIGVRLEGNLNVTSASAYVFVHGLQFTDQANQSVTGSTKRVFGSWADGSAAQDGVHVSVGEGGLTFAETSIVGFAPAADQVVIFAEDNGAGKTRLMARFATGANQQIAIQP